jgi:hypothetical protein
MALAYEGAFQKRQVVKEHTIRVLQCLSTFYLPSAPELSLIAFAMTAEFVNCSVTQVRSICARLERDGYISLNVTKDAARLDQEEWLARSASARMMYFAHFVSSAPRSLRDEYSQEALDPRCCRILKPMRQSAGVTAASSYNGVFSSDRDCPVSAEPDLEERLFVPTLYVRDVAASRNLWYLASALSESFFRRELLLLYTTGRGGELAIDIVDRGACILLCVSDNALSTEQAMGLVAYEVEEPEPGAQALALRGCVRFLRTLDGTSVHLDTHYGVAWYGGEMHPRIYQQRGMALNGVEILELDAKGSGAPRREIRTRGPLVAHRALNSEGHMIDLSSYNGGGDEYAVVGCADAL